MQITRLQLFLKMNKPELPAPRSNAVCMNHLRQTYAGCILYSALLFICYLSQSKKSLTP
jgi:hypothetical protein